ncbi:TEA/ATTS domain family-domain-containing protein [Cokeromyces recurvatus]|uniref:TEA/ATTS domain family-domain-containing protein n=1 Tax=Cokeromyces recurvatus TaxID=90255 RepID=UPI002220F142|nr:TEA/ATTS domain family-domain-containing protein [Cokeromyces recurvatus]XP_051380135.1 TEA/ATTS domain family-domain-containing protein [Cokeromyces recurvatus]KAI7899134.1 TEA/ATTS domain family-domain-containing protein [Cokeromyces recurvatus]KAI7900150.1 TEA/ATTS domain family-domain-containing protein [Cokeromyces recurvatus]
MLAYSQDSFIHHHNNNNSNSMNQHQLIHEQQTILNSMCRHNNEQHRKDSIISIDNNNSEIDAIMNKEEQVWPPDVEAAFIEALESIPKLGRRKILVNGKPCEYIFRKTSKIRTRKQVSSHIQVLKNTRKGDAYFMRLLTDYVDLDNNGNHRNHNLIHMQPLSPIEFHHQQFYCQHPVVPNAVKMNTFCSIDSFSSDESSIQSSPSSNEYLFDFMYHDPSHQPQAFSMFQFNPLLSNIIDPNEPLMPSFDETFSIPTETNSTKAQPNKSNNNNNDNNNNNSLPCGLWPNYFCLYLDYNVISKDKCPILDTLLMRQSSSKEHTLLLAKINLDLNLDISGFAFNNTSFFESQTRRTIECTTTIYSFGNVVLESKEVQQALWINEGKYMYSFAFVNQFFDAFMKGIRTLQSWEEVDIAINNLCIIQTFEDIEYKYPLTKISNNSSFLLTLIYEFKRGTGPIEVSLVEQKEFDKGTSN